MKKNFYIYFFITFCMFQSLPIMARTVSVMSYNVENLFDNVHDEGKKDWTYLPLEVKKKSSEVQAYCKSQRVPMYRDECFNLDWSDKILSKKIQQISKVIRSYDNGKGPDIIVVQEVENLNVLTMLRDQGLANLGYQEVVLLEGPDVRGIDVGMISRFPLASPAILHPIDLSELSNRSGGFSSKTRGILEATFDIDGALVTIFGNHWSSQSNIDETRLIEARTLYNAAKNVKNSAVLALGDFNTIESDSPHGINEYILSSSKEYSFYDAVDPLHSTKSDDEMDVNHFINRDVDALVNNNINEGSHWYKGKWQFLDHIFLMKSTTFNPDDKDANCSIHTCVGPVWNTFAVHKADFMMREITYVDRRTGKTTKYKVPWRFDANKGQGYSDHLPITLQFLVNY